MHLNFLKTKKLKNGNKFENDTTVLYFLKFNFIINL